jgi:hypothetical protein
VYKLSPPVVSRPAPPSCYRETRDRGRKRVTVKHLTVKHVTVKHVTVKLVTVKPVTVKHVNVKRVTVVGGLESKARVF